MEPSKTSGGLYQRVTTSFEYVFVGTLFALASPVSYITMCTRTALSIRTLYTDFRTPLTGRI